MKKSIKRLLIIIAASFLSLELGLQAAGAFINLRSKINNHYQGAFVILCIGDSFTFGIGAAKNESYPSQLETILHQAYPEKNLQVINLGMPGYNSSQCLNLLKEKYNSYNPALVLAMTGMNNCWNWVDNSYLKIEQLKNDHFLRYRMVLADTWFSKIKTYKLIKILFFNLRNYSKPLSASGGRLYKTKFIPPQRSAPLQEMLNQGRKYYEEGKYREAEAYFLKAMVLAPEDHEPHWFMGRLHRLLYSDEARAEQELLLALKYANDPVLTIDIACETWDQDPNSPTFIKLVKLFKEMRQTWINKFGQEYVRQLIDPIVLSGDRLRQDILSYDLTQMRDFLETKGARMAILTYPLPSEGFRLPGNIYNLISKRLNLPLIDNASVFHKYLSGDNPENLFVGDGHCNAKGYRIITENILAALVKYKLLWRN
jgi:lysophospholipase L1-like esterase